MTRIPAPRSEFGAGLQTPPSAGPKVSRGVDSRLTFAEVAKP